MKKFLIFSLILGLTVSITACGSKGSQEPPALDDMIQQEPISEEEQALMERSIRFTSDKLLSYDTWKKVMALPNLECQNHISGYIDDVVLGNEKDLRLSGEPELEENGLFVTYKLIEGKLPADDSMGGCVIPASMAEKMGKKVGDKITIETPLGKAEYEITGLYGYSEKGEVGGLTEENSPLFEIFVTPQDIVKLAGEKSEGYFLGNTVTCATPEEAKNFVDQANENLKDYGVKAMLSSDSSADMFFSDSNEMFESVKLEGTDFDGNALPEDLLAKDGVTMVNVWATFCNPCLAEMSHLEELNNEFKAEGKNFKVIGIAADILNDKGEINEDSLALAKEILSKIGVTYQNMIPSNDLQNDTLSKVTAYPTSFFLNEDGKVIKTVMGATTKEDWTRIANELIESLK